MTVDRIGTNPAHVTDDELVDLLHGFLPAGHREVVVTHLLDCLECDRRFQAVAGEHERGLALAAAHQHSLGSLPTRDETASRTLRSVRFGGPRAWLAAAAVLLVIGISWTMALRGTGMNSSPALRARHEWLSSTVPDGNLREATDSGPDSTILAGIAAYERRDLHSAESLLRSTRSSGAYEMVRRLYLGNTLVALGQSAEAVGVLAAQGWLLPEPWHGEWDWAFMVACAQSGQAQRADSLFQVLRQRDDEIGAHARALAHDANRRR